MSDSREVLDYDAQFRVQPNDLIAAHYLFVGVHEQEAVLAQKRRISECSGGRYCIEFLYDAAVGDRDRTIKATPNLIK
jgi:hypothetical protein